MDKVKRIDPDCEVFVPCEGQAIKLPNGNSVALHATEKHDDWMFEFINNNHDRHTLLRLSPEALYAVMVLSYDRLQNGTLKRPAFNDEENEKKEST